MLVGWQRVKVVTRTTIKMASGVQDITCVFVEVAGSHEKKLILQCPGMVCIVHQWCRNVLVRLTGGWELFKPDQDILHAIFLQLAAVIRVTFTPFLLNFPQMLELVGSYLHDFIWPQCLLLWLDISLRKMS